MRVNLFNKSDVDIPLVSIYNLYQSNDRGGILNNTAINMEGKDMNVSLIVNRKEVVTCIPNKFINFLFFKEKIFVNTEKNYIYDFIDNYEFQSTMNKLLLEGNYYLWVPIIEKLSLNDDNYLQFSYAVDAKTFKFKIYHLNYEDTNNRELLVLKEKENRPTNIKLIGFFNPYHKIILPLVPITRKDYKTIQQECSKSSCYKLFNTVNFNTIKIGVENEQLLTDNTHSTIYPAHIEFLENLNRTLKYSKEFIDKFKARNSREYFNYFFCNGDIGVDSRRIIQENRTKPIFIHFKSENNYLKELENLIEQIKNNYSCVQNMIPKPIVAGGGIHGETIGVHIHFNLEFQINFLILLNKLIGEPLQNMRGGKRPELINPSDTFTLNERDRSPNHYGFIDYDNIKVGGHDQIRTKSYSNGEQGFEYRNPPNFFLNKAITFNVLATILKLIELDYKGFDFPIDKKTTVNKDTWQNIFENFVPAWEFWYQKNQLNLADNPYKYFLGYNKEILNKVNITSTHFQINNFNKFLKEVYQYIPNINSTINIKIESGEQNRIIVPARKNEGIKHLLELYRIPNIKVLNSAFNYENNYYLQFSFLKDKEIESIFKSFLLTATNKEI